MRYLNPAEIAYLAEVIRRPYRALVFVGAYGGLRIGELAGLRRSRVDLDAGTVDVARALPRRSPNGPGTPRSVSCSTATATFSPELDAALGDRLDVLFRQVTEHGRNTDG
jgi:integrase